MVESLKECTIDEFWLPRLGSIVRPPVEPTLTGWTAEAERNPSFVEADLNLRNGCDDLTIPVWFVAAPGAVGKSTLAKEVSAQTGAVYLDLAKADTVAGNYLTGGLVKNQLLEAWRDNRTTVLIDALDEARLRVTQTSFEDFPADVKAVSQKRTLPVVFFGRVGIVEEASLILSDKGLNCPIFDIDFFDTRRAELFVMAALRRHKQLAGSIKAHESVYKQAVANFVKGLEHTAASDGARFAGYAPVLEAVATVLSAVKNPARLDDAVQETMQGQVLHRLTEYILERESDKLRDQLKELIPNDVRQTLYRPEEQLTRLAAKIYKTPALLPPIQMQAQHVAAYDNAVSSIMPSHPFLDGSSLEASGAVFGAVINAHALFSPSPETVAAAERRASRVPYTPNPFLIDFYLDEAKRRLGDNFLVPPEVIVALYESVRARASVSAVVRLTVEGDEGGEGADAEIQISNGGLQSPHRILLRTSQAGVLQFGRQVNGVSVDAPHLDVVIGSGNPVEMVAPVSLNVASLTFDCPELVVQPSDRAGDSEDSSVVIDASRLAQSKVTAAPSVRKGAEFSVSWPGASSYPWVNFANTSSRTEGGDLDDGLRALRRLVLAFRSRGKGRLARCKDKIEHVRMTKGNLGTLIRKQMMRDLILSLEDDWYFLDPNILGRVVGASYQELKLKRFNEKVRQYVASVKS